MKKLFAHYPNLRRRAAIAAAILLPSVASAMAAAAPLRIPATGTADMLRSMGRLTLNDGSHRISWTGRLQTIIRLESPFLRGHITAKIRQNLQLAEGDIGFHLWLRRQKPARQAIFPKLMSAKIQRLASMAFSPGTQDRSKAAGLMAGLPLPVADTLLDTLIADNSQSVRLHAIKALTRIEPDTSGLTELFWLATYGQKAGRLQYNLLQRMWHSWRRQLAANSSNGGIVERFRSSDARAAALALAAWHSSMKHAVLQSLVPPLLRHACRPNANYSNVSEAWPALAWRQPDMTNLLHIARPQTLGPILLGILAAPAAEKGHNISPQGRRYYRSSHTVPLFVALMMLRQNPIKNGIVLTGRRNEYGLHVPGIICAISHGAQQRAIVLVKRLFAARHITGLAKTRSPAVPGNPLLSANAGSVRISLGTMEIGIIKWLRWTTRLSTDRRNAMLAWGLAGANANQAALAFSPSTAGQMDAARVLVGQQSASVAIILGHLLKSRRPAVQLTAIKMMRSKLNNPAFAAALVKFALHRQTESKGLPRSAQHWPRRRESRRQAFRIRRAAIKALRELPQQTGQFVVIQAACALANQNNGLLVISRRTRFCRRSAENALRFATHFIGPPCAASLLADIASARLHRLARHHADDRIIPLLLLCRLAHRPPQQFGLSRLASRTESDIFPWYATSGSQINAGVIRMLKFWASRHVKPNAQPPTVLRPPA